MFAAMQSSDMICLSQIFPVFNPRVESSIASATTASVKDQRELWLSIDVKPYIMPLACPVQAYVQKFWTENKLELPLLSKIDEDAECTGTCRQSDWYVEK